MAIGTERPAAAAMLAAACVLAGGCSSPRAVDEAVRELAEHRARQPAEANAAAVTDAFAARGDSRAVGPGVELDLPAALRLATRYSRELQSRREQLLLTGLSTLSARRDFGPQLSGTLSYVLSSPADGSDTRTTSLGLDATQVLRSGATLAAGAGSTAVSTNGAGNPAYGNSASLSLTQPLLAGAGYEASHDSLIQAERDLVYGLRDFALYRQDFAIRILRSYYGLLIQKSVVENTRQTAEQSTFLRKRSEAMFKVRRVAIMDVLRSQQQDLASSNALSQAESDFDVSVSRFLIELGLPVGTRVTLIGALPPLRPLGLDLEACLRTALERRLDLKNEGERAEDARRRLRIARRARWPELGVFGQADWSGESESSATDVETEPDLSAGATLELPLDRRDERDAVRSAEIAVAAAARRVEAARDELAVGIRESFRRLASLAASAGIEAKNMALAQRRMDYAILRFKSGELSNRDVVEAQNELLNARNAHARALVACEQQRVQALRDVGLLDVAADGTLAEPASVRRGEETRRKP